MDCTHARIALSARLDGEDPGVLEGTLDAHVSGCAGCRAFVAAAERLHRTVRVGLAEEVPDLSPAILDAIAAEAGPSAAGERVRDRITILRVLLAVVGLVQLAMALPAVILGEDSNLPAHAARHIGSFALALAVGFLWVAWAPERAAGLVPVAAVLVACLMLTSLADVAAGRAAAGTEVAHAPELAGLVAAWLLGRTRAGWSRPVLGFPSRPALR